MSNLSVSFDSGAGGGSQVGAWPILARGFTTGLLGALLVGIWHLAVDVVRGSALEAPAALGAALGTAVGTGMTSPAAAPWTDASSAPASLVLLGLGAHVALFCLAGLAAAILEARRWFDSVSLPAIVVVLAMPSLAEVLLMPDAGGAFGGLGELVAHALGVLAMSVFLLRRRTE